MSHYTDIDSRGRVVRDLLAHRRVLIVLDNARNSDEVTPLLPPTGRCSLIITTRHHDLAVTTGTHRFHLRPFDKEKNEALNLFAKILGEARVCQDQEELAQVADLLGHLPLAVNIVASRLAHEPDWLAADLLTRLHQEKERLDQLSFANQSMRLSTNLSYDALATNLQQFFATLGVFGSAQFSAEAVAYVNGLPREVAQDNLRKLHSLSLVQLGQPGRYRLHPLLHDYAREKLAPFDQGDGPYFGRMVDFFVQYAQVNTRDYAALAVEMDNILAALDVAYTGHRQVALVSGINAFAHYLQTQGLHQLAEIHLNRAVEAANALQDMHGLATVWFHLGKSKRQLTQYAQAKQELERGLALAYQLDDKEKICALLGELGIAATFLSDPKTLRYWEDALHLAYQLEDEWQIAFLRNALGATAVAQREFEAAREHLEEGLIMARRAGFHERTAGLLNNLGMLAAHEENYKQAVPYFDEALVLSRQIGHQTLIATALANLGECVMKQDNYIQAERHFQDGLDLARQLDDQRLICHFLDGLGATTAHRGKLCASRCLFFSKRGQLCRKSAISFF